MTAVLGIVLSVIASGLANELLVDSDFNASSGSTALRANSAGQDWYESRQDNPNLLTLDTAVVGGNATKKGKLTGSTGGNAYLTQEFSSPQTGRFTAQWRIYVDSITNISGHPDCAGWMMIGDDSDPSNKGPNASDSERFVYMAFFKNGGGTSGTMDLVAMERSVTTLTPIASNLSLDRWYTIRVDVDLVTDSYDVYIDNQPIIAAWPSRRRKSSVTHISFAQWNDGAGTFYVDDVTAESSSQGQGGEVVIVDDSYHPGGLIDPEMPIESPGQVAQSWLVTRAPAGAEVTGLSYLITVRPVFQDFGGEEPFRCSDYEIGLSSAAQGGTDNYSTVWDNLGGETDQGLDDDAENDKSITLSRSTSVFNGQPANQRWYFRVKDTVSGPNYGCLTRLRIVIQYGKESVSCPSVTTLAPTAIQCASAALGGRITDDGGEACQYRFRYRKEGGSYVYTNYTGSKRTGESFSQVITGLSSGTKYYFAAQAKNSACESAWGSELSFTTGQLRVDTQAATTIKCGSATLNGRVVDDGGLACQYRFRHRTRGGSYTYTNYAGSKRTNESFSQALPGLSPGTTYYFAAQAKNAACESAWGAELSFTTVQIQAVTQAATAIRCNSATLNGRVAADGGEACQYRFRYKEAGGAYTETAWTGSRRAGESFSRTLTGLKPGTRYYFAARVKNSSCEGPWGNELTFVTLLRAETQAATEIKCTTATLNARVADDGGAPCQHRFRYKKEGGPYTETVWTGSMRTGESFSYALTGLSQGTKYYFAAQVKNSSCESLWSTELTFTTLKPPTVMPLPATGIDARGATLNGKIVDDGGGPCQYQFRYRLRGGQYTETPWAGSVRGANRAFNALISGLTPTTTYFFAVRARNNGCEGLWSGELSFTTLTVVKPVAAALDPTNVLDRSATLVGTIVDDGNEPCQYRFRYERPVSYAPTVPTPRPPWASNSDAAENASAIEVSEERERGTLQEQWTYTNTSWTGAKQSGETFRQDITSLHPNMTYAVSTQARNSAGESPWSAGVTFTTLAIPEITDIYGTHFTQAWHDYFLDGVYMTEMVTVRVNWRGAEPGKIEWKTPKRTYETSVDSGAAAFEVTRTFNVGADLGAGGKLMVRAVPSPDAQGAKESAWVTANFTVIPPPPGIPKEKLSPLPIDGGAVYAGEFSASLLDESVPPGTISDEIEYFSQEELGLSWGFPIQVSVMNGTATYLPIELPRLSVYAAGGELKGKSTFALFCSYRNGQWQPEGFLDIIVDANFRTPSVWIYIPPVFAFTFHVVIGLEVDTLLDIVDWPQGQNPDLEGLLCIEPYGEGHGVAGLGEFLGVGGWLGVGVRMCLDYQEPDRLVELCAHFRGGTRECILFFCFEQELFDFTTGCDSRKTNLMAAAFGTDPVACKACNGEFQLMNRDYIGPDYARWLPPSPGDDGQGGRLTILSAADGAPGESGEELVLQANVFGRSKPSIAADGDQLFLAWAYDDPNRSSVNRTKVVFSKSDGGIWTAPQPIHDDGAVDFSPQLSVLPNGQVLCAWEKLNRILPDDVDVTGMASAMEVAVASYDNEIGLWNTEVLTADSHMDRTPRIAAGDNDTALVVWIHNDRDDVRSEDPSALNTIRYSLWDGSTWSSPAAAATGIGCMLKTALAYNGTQAVYVYSVDDDWDMGTNTDHELYALIYDGTQWLPPRRLTNDEVLDASPQVVYDGNDSLLVWYRQGQVVSCRNLDPNDYRLALEATESAGAIDFRMAKAPGGRISLVWTDASTATKGVDVFASMYDPSFDLWGNAFALTSDADVERALAVAFAGPDELALAYNKDRLRASPTGPQEIYQTDLCVLRHGLGRDLAISPEDITMGRPDPRRGGSVPITAVVHNLGDVPEVNVPVAFYYGDPGEDGELIGDPQTIFGPIPGGDTATASITWTVPQTDSVIELYVVVFDTADPQTGLPERDTNNNVACVPVTGPNLTVESVSVAKTGYKTRTVAVRIANHGPVSAQDVELTIRRDSPDGEELTRVAVPTIGANSVEEVWWNWDIASLTFDDPEVVVYVIVDESNTVAEMDESNNTALALAHVSKTADITDNGSVDGDDLAALAWQWLNKNTDSDSEELIDCDLDNDGRINLSDFSVLGKDWLWEAQWHAD